ncbi:MAG: anthranilate phosphoribosyltransferase [Candidatus Omnitrophica bacterium]|nr:anthranilate phosphoribosyltransferase [Candidatus Omnitrophota bacterium]MDD5672077.1 anthranilate phosphoribosyltransferase [Candidatus Omnitrophota bacterium]
MRKGAKSFGGDIAGVLTGLLEGRSLTEIQAEQIFGALFRGSLKDGAAKALLVLLADKGETAAEIIGCIRAIRDLEPVETVRIPHLMDTCGTGGDRSHSFNISTVAALVIAGAGGKVAKHGNHAISSKCGSSDLMIALGVRLDAPKGRMIDAIRRFGIGYFHAPFYHPSFRTVQGLRCSLRTRTIFNYLGPLLNPLKLEAQLVGVSRETDVDLYAHVIRRLAQSDALVCHSGDGLDEISTARSTGYALIRNKSIRYGKIVPGRCGFNRAKGHDYAGGTARENARLTLRILTGKRQGPLTDVIMMNAAAGLMISGVVKDINSGIRLAKNAIESGKAMKALNGLIKLSNRK